MLIKYLKIYLLAVVTVSLASCMAAPMSASRESALETMRMMYETDQILLKINPGSISQVMKDMENNLSSAIPEGFKNVNVDVQQDKNWMVVSFHNNTMSHEFWRLGIQFYVKGTEVVIRLKHFSTEEPSPKHYFDEVSKSLIKAMKKAANVA